MRVVACLFLLVLPATLFSQSPDFGRDILPILSDKCFHCHGPDASARKANLRLDTREGAFRVHKGKAAIVPGKSDASELIQRIISSDTSEVMPPPDSNRSLTEKQKDLLKRWVESGAKWDQHWAFVAPTRTAVPTVKQKEWPRQTLDQFILAKVEAQGLKPAPQATKEAWLRRVTLDLTGLPPSLTELDAFLADTSPNAYAKQVDRLLASPRYGERMATDWLDLARYADTHGYQMDRYRPMWPYRDWVVKAFNQNLPFDQFATWQLAGDLLPSATKDQRLATAFNRLHMQNEEGGIIEEEYRVSYVVDRVNTFGTAFLGMTMDCTRCHDHKYDPLTMKDYYSLFSMFQNIDESGQTSYFTSSMPVPTLLLSDEKTDQKLDTLQQAIIQQEKLLCKAEAKVSQDQAFLEWLSKRSERWSRTGLQASYSFDELAGNKTPNQLDKTKPGQGHDNPKLVAGKDGRAILLDGENGFTFPGVGHFSRVDSFSISLWIKPPAPTVRAVVLHHSKAPIDAGSRGYELLLEQNRVAFGLHHMWPGNAAKVVSKIALPVGEWSHVAITYDGSSKAAGMKCYVNGVSVPVEVVRDNLYKDITYGGDEPSLALGYRFRDNGFKGGFVDELKVYRRELSPIDVLADFEPEQLSTLWKKPIDQLTVAEKQSLLQHFLLTANTTLRTTRAELHKLRAEHNKLINPISEAMVMQELAKPKPAYILKRGAYDSLGDPVTGNTPAVLPAMKAEFPRNRLGLARWLFEENHPLTSRVAVNRLWQQMFGIGLLDTSDNFGTQGGRPTHPELLDWLALEFAQPTEPGAKPWDVKRMLKMFALSATYLQESKATSEQLAKDGDNKWLARYPVRRLSAEMLRDQALSFSALLVEKQGGPAVKPYQPDGLWEVAMGNPRYDRSKGPDLYRRSVYSFWKRTVPPPAMVTFDATERNVCIVKRQATSTPLQALALLNDVQMVECAKLLAQRMQQQPGSTKERIAWAFRLATGRVATEKEVQVLLAIWNEQRELFKKDVSAATKLLATGDTPVDKSLPTDELAANTIVALAILNHDGVVQRR